MLYLARAPQLMLPAGWALNSPNATVAWYLGLGFLLRLALAILSLLLSPFHLAYLTSRLTCSLYSQSSPIGRLQQSARQRQVQAHLP